MKVEQLALPQAHRNSDLLGKRWTCPYGDAEVVRVDGVRLPGFVLVCVEQPERQTAFDALLTADFVRRELAANAPPRDEWVPDGEGSYFNLTENRRLAALGLVPLAELAREAEPAPQALGSASRGGSVRCLPQPTERRATVPTTTKPTTTKPKKSKRSKSGLAGLSKAKLRDYLLSHQTIPDKAWNAAYRAPARKKGESREQYIRRVLS